MPHAFRSVSLYPGSHLVHVPVYGTSCSSPLSVNVAHVAVSQLATALHVSAMGRHCSSGHLRPVTPLLVSSSPNSSFSKFLAVVINARKLFIVSGVVGVQVDL